MKKYILLLLLFCYLLPLCVIAQPQPEAPLLNCYEKFQQRGKDLLAKGQYLQAINLYKAARECEDADEDRRRAMDDAIEQAQAQQREKENQLATRAGNLLEKLEVPGENPYQTYLSSGIDKFREGDYQEAIYDFAIARFKEHTEETEDWITRAENGLAAEGHWGKGQIETALHFYQKAASGDTTEDYTLRKIRKCPAILNYWAEKLSTTEPFVTFSLVEYPFTMAPEKIFGDPAMTKLQSLTIRSNANLSSLPESFGQLPQLQSMYISYNDKLASLPKSFTELKALDILEVTWKPEWGPVLAQLESLKTIIITGSENLNGSIETLMQLPQLRTLIFSFNRNLRQLPEDLDSLSSLEVLEITNNENLLSLPENLGELPNLKRLVIRECPRLDDLPASLAKLTTLEELEVVDTGVSEAEIERLRGELPECKIVYED